MTEDRDLAARRTRARTRARARLGAARTLLSLARPSADGREASEALAGIARRAVDVVHADSVAIYVRHDEGDSLDLVVAKNRQGDIGKITLIFRPDLGTLREEERR